MENDWIEIEPALPEAAPEGKLALPQNILSLGTIENDDVAVYIRQDVYNALERLAASDTEKELGSILLGHYCHLNGRVHVVICGYVEAKYTDASASTLTFTHKTWEYVHAEQAKHYPDQKIIGWQHTHPSYGIFLSNYDMFIQENFFNLPFQIAYVIDPVQNLRGFFQWKNGKVERLKGYYLYDAVGKPIQISRPEAKAPEKKAPETKTRTNPVIGLLCALCLILSLSLILTGIRFGQFRRDTLAQLDRQAAAIAALEAQPEETVPAASDPVSEALEDHDSRLQAQEELLDQIDSTLESLTGDANIRFLTYTVQAGDTLLGICQAHGVDYYANVNIILGINGIRNPGLIRTGQTLLLPVWD